MPFLMLDTRPLWKQHASEWKMRRALTTISGHFFCAAVYYFCVSRYSICWSMSSCRLTFGLEFRETPPEVSYCQSVWAAHCVRFVVAEVASDARSQLTLWA